MSTKFITDDLEKLIKINVIQKTYQNLNTNHQNILSTYFYGLTQMIATSYGFYDDKDKFIAKIKQNSYKDLRWLLTFLLPYTDTRIKQLSELKDLNELYSLRYDKLNESEKNKLRQFNVEDINIVAPKYVFSNIQYGRCTRGSSNKSIAFSEEHIKDNYYLLLNTILTTRNKMYINWIDILPYRMDTYKSEQLYISTKNAMINKTIQIVDPVVDYPIEKIRDEEQIKKLNDKLKGLNVEDIYNTISLDLYESIVKYKWLLFDIGFNVKGSIVTEPLINVLNKIVNLRNVMYDTEWNNTEKNAQDIFIRQWNVLVEAYEKNFEVVLNSGTGNSGAIKTIIKSFVVFFDRGYSKINTLRNNKKYIPLNRKSIRDDFDDLDYYEEERMQDVSDIMVLKTVKSIDYVYVYDFLLESVQGFKKTWFSLHMMSPDKTELSDKPTYQIIKNNKYITFKNIYNFCKSMVHEQNTNVNNTDNEKNKDNKFSSDYVRLPRTWAELDDRLQSLILSRLNNTSNSWFNIRRNMYYVIKQSSPNANDGDINAQVRTDMVDLYNAIRLHLVDIIFESTIGRGTLSYMVAETDLTDNTLYDTAISEQKTKLVNEISSKRFYKGNPYGDNSYYFLTDKPFNQTGTYSVKINNKNEDYDYFKTNSTVRTAWYVSTTYHWVAQIGFCHRFINNRVNYITGGTGAGKSTQVPKLYMYYLKAIDRIINPTVVVTVPRTNVATGVSSFISQELAVPYEDEELDSEIKKEINLGSEKGVGLKTQKEFRLKKNNKYIQYKHMNGNNVDDGIYPKIRFITDGSVLTDAKDPFLKTKKVVGDQTIYLRNNKYDVIIIDEAHEHNANMDMILTTIINALYYNNKIRLVIMSATMDADEPTYRRFYRDINDNRKYPLNNWIKKYNLDRINTERRFHISPPGETTRFKITEHYRPNEDANDIVREITKISTTGDILLFQPGIKDIADSVTLLNTPGVMPDDVIAIPYHAQLKDYIKIFIGGIDKNLKDLRIDKQRDITTTNSQKDLYTGNNSYTRCVLVATNIAEASISIPSLRYVVDTGLEKTMKFDFERRSNVLVTNYITDASRVQRKGRVGRVAPGTVYYMYAEGSLINNTKQFNIAVQDIHQTVMLELLRDPNDTPIITDLTDSIASGIPNSKSGTSSFVSKIGNNRDNVIALIKTDILNHMEKSGKNTDDNTTAYADSVATIVADNYMAPYGLYDYYGKNTHYDYENARHPKKTYFSGFDIEQLTDSLGEFYIVHPDELVIKRNINGEIVGADQYQVITKPITNNNFRQKMTSNKIIVFWETLINSAFVGIKTTKTTKIQLTSGNSELKIISRTRLGELLRFCASNLTIFKDDSLIRMLFYGYGLSKNDDEFERVLNIVAMIDTIGIESVTKKLINNSYVNYMIENNQNNPYIKSITEKALRTKIISNFSGSGSIVKSDIYLMDSISKYIESIFQNNNTEYNLFKSKLLKQTNFDGENILDIQKGVPTDNKKNNVITNQKALARRNKLLENITKQHINDLYDVLSKNALGIANTGLDISVIEKYVGKKEIIRKEWSDIIYDVRNTGDTKNMNIGELKILLKEYRHLMDNHSIDILKGVLLLSRPYSIKRKILNTESSYASVYSPHPNTIVTLPQNSTFTDPMYYQEYILNLSENLEYRTISTILDVNIKDMALLANIYNKRVMKRNLYERKLTTNEKSKYMDEYIKSQYPDTNTLITNDDTNKSFQNNYRDQNISEHIIAVSNLNATSQIISRDVESIQNSEVFTINEHLGSEYLDYRKILQNV